jgi:hypothetical protein
LFKNFKKDLFSVNPVNLLQLGIQTLNQFGKDKEENYDNQKTISKKQITVQGNFPEKISVQIPCGWGELVQRCKSRRVYS